MELPRTENERENLVLPATDIVVIPAYQPDSKLLALVKNLSRYPCLEIIVVNDGSGADYDDLFGLVENYATVLTHLRNCGKGCAIRTALWFIHKKRKWARAVVTADADGQHRPEDIRRVLDEAKRGGRCLVLGTRMFTGNVPVKSRFGNTVTRAVFQAASGRRIQDTQTGLRAFDARLLPMLLNIPGDRYEYEMNMLLELSRRRVRFREVTIETVYIDENQSSHFRAVKDSLLIYQNIFRFMGSSLICFLIDYGLYGGFGVIALRMGAEAATAAVCGNIGARLVSSCCNFLLNRRFVFEHKGNAAKAAAKYFLLAAGILAVNTALLAWLVSALGMNRMAAKLLVEGGLFVVSYLVQRLVVFRK